VKRVVAAADAAFRDWRLVPAPKRGEFVRRLGQKLRERRADLAALVSWEAGKITQEALGEVQEMIDVCDYAVGLSRPAYGLTIAASGRAPDDGAVAPARPVGVITAFNFPVAVWAWNAALALVCGEPGDLEAEREDAADGDRLPQAGERGAGRHARRCRPAIMILLVGRLRRASASPLAAVAARTRSCPRHRLDPRSGKQVAVTVAQRLGRS
jgi:aldehyde dehydrogenase (NAD+)